MLFRYNGIKKPDIRGGISGFCVIILCGGMAAIVLVIASEQVVDGNHGLHYAAIHILFYAKCCDESQLKTLRFL